VLSTVGLTVLTDLRPAEVAGTVMITNVATGIVGSLAFLRSGHLREPATARTAATLLLAAVVGAPVGVRLNALLSRSAFSILLAGFVLIVAALVWYRHRGARRRAPGPASLSVGVLAVVGAAIAIASGMFGVGGPLLAVPMLVALGSPLLQALAAAQVQSIAISLVGGIGYASIGAVNWLLVLVIGAPQLCGALLGWRIARSVRADVLRWTMIVVLVATAPALLLTVV
jgi:uncharacterized membrane protein YfcA